MRNRLGIMAFVGTVVLVVPAAQAAPPVQGPTPVEVTNEPLVVQDASLFADRFVWEDEENLGDVIEGRSLTVEPGRTLVIESVSALVDDLNGGDGAWFYLELAPAGSDPATAKQVIFVPLVAQGGGRFVGTVTTHLVMETTTSSRVNANSATTPFGGGFASWWVTGYYTDAP